MGSTQVSNLPTPSVEYDEKILPKEVVEAAELSSPELDPTDEKKLVRKVDLFLLPAIFVTYLLSYMVRIR